MSEEQNMKEELKKDIADPTQKLTFEIDNPEELSDEELEAAAGGLAPCSFRSRVPYPRPCLFKTRTFNANDEV